MKLMLNRHTVAVRLPETDSRPGPVVVMDRTGSQREVVPVSEWLARHGRVRCCHGTKICPRCRRLRRREDES